MDHDAQQVLIWGVAAGAIGVALIIMAVLIWSLIVTRRPR